MQRDQPLSHCLSLSDEIPDTPFYEGTKIQQHMQSGKQWFLKRHLTHTNVLASQYIITSTIPLQAVQMYTSFQNTVVDSNHLFLTCYPVWGRA